MAEALLKVEALRAGYGDAVILGGNPDGLSFTLAAGRSLALLGRNGAGKTTLLTTLVGHTRRHAGRIWLDGTELTLRAPHQRALAGLGWVPQERNIFKSLTVAENLSAVAQPGPWTVERVFALFPRLQERRRNLGSQLSGGEQQMLAIARALVLNPKLLLLDEPTEGLAPIIVEELLQAIRRIVRDDGLAAVIVEQHAAKILQLTDEALVLDRGGIVHAGRSDALLADPALMAQHLGVAGG